MFHVEQKRPNEEWLTLFHVEHGLGRELVSTDGIPLQLKPNPLESNLRAA